MANTACPAARLEGHVQLLVHCGMKIVCRYQNNTTGLLSEPSDPSHFAVPKWHTTLPPLFSYFYLFGDWEEYCQCFGQGAPKATWGTRWFWAKEAKGFTAKAKHEVLVRPCSAGDHLVRLHWWSLRTGTCVGGRGGARWSKGTGEHAKTELGSYFARHMPYSLYSLPNLPLFLNKKKSMDHFSQ